MPSNTKKITRRDLLAKSAQTTAALAASASLSSCVAASHRSHTRKRWPEMRFGFTTYQWGKDWDIETLIDNCTAARALGVELRTSQSYAHGVELELADYERQGVRARFEDSPITLVGLATSERFDSPDPQKLQDAIENAKAYIKLSHDVGGTGVRVFPNDYHDEVPKETTIEQIGEALNILGAFAADYGQEVRLESHGSAGDLFSIMAIMNHVTQPSVGVKLNSSQRDAEGMGIEHNIRLVKDRLGGTIHAHDFLSATFPNQEQLNVLAEVGWGGWLLLEQSSKVPDRVAALTEQRRVCERMITKALDRVY